MRFFARNRREHVKIVWNGWYLRGAVTKEGVQTFVRRFRSTRCVLLLGVSPRGSANARLSEGGEDGCLKGRLDMSVLDNDIR